MKLFAGSMKLAKLFGPTLLLVGTPSTGARGSTTLSFPVGRINASVSDTFIRQSMKQYELVTCTSASCRTGEGLVQVLEKAKVGLTCKKAAAERLVSSCKVLNDNAVTEEKFGEAVEKAKTLFAARFAGCDSREAGYSFPSQCTAAMSFSAPAQQVTLDADINGKELKSCLSAIHKKEQMWTSFSVAHQESNTICQAASLAVDREALLKTYGNLAQFVEEVKSELLNIHAGAVAHSQFQSSFMDHLRNILQSYKDDLGVAFQNSKADLGSVVDHVKNSLARATSNVETSLVAVQEQVTDQLSGLTESANYSLKLKATLDQLSQNILSNHAEWTARQMEGFEAVLNKTQEADKAVRGLAHSSVPQLQNQLQVIQNIAEYLGNVVTEVGLKLGSVGEKGDVIYKSFDEFIDLQNIALDIQKHHNQLADSTTASLTRVNALAKSLEPFLDAMSSFLWPFIYGGIAFMFLVVLKGLSLCSVPPKLGLGVIIGTVSVARAHQMSITLPHETTDLMAWAATWTSFLSLLTVIAGFTYAYIAPKCRLIYRSRVRKLEAERERNLLAKRAIEDLQIASEKRRFDRAQTAPPLFK